MDSREWGRVLHLPDFIAMLGYDSGPSLKVYWLLSGKTLADGLRIVDSEVEINVMNSVCNKIKNFVIYFDHTDHVSGRNHEDILLTPAAELPEVFSPTRDDHQEPNLSTDEHTAEVNQKPKGIEEEEVEEYDLLEGSDDSSADSNFVDSDYEWEDDDDDLFEDNVDGGVVDIGLGKKRFSHKKATESKLKGKQVSTEDYTEQVSSDDEGLQLPDNSDDEGDITLRFKSFNPEDINNPVFKVGMVFPSVEVIRKAITEYSLKNRVDIKLPRNDRERIRAHCAEGCPWNLYASMDSRVKSFVVKTYVAQHKCKKEWVLQRCTANWLAEKYVDTFRADLKMTLSSFLRTVQKDWNLTPSRSKLARARRLALKEIYGDEVGQYNLLDSCKRGFLSSYRPVICLDACHIKTKFGGQLLTAVGVDPNDCIFPIAMAVVEVESYNTWSWFL